MFAAYGGFWAYLSQLAFANPVRLYWLLALLPVVAWYIWKQQYSQSAISFSTIKTFKNVPRTYKYYFKHVPFILRVLSFILLILIWARPQSTNMLSNENVEGIDIVITLDISGSMIAQDLKPNRLEASKNVASEFIMGRPNDNIGLVIFSEQSFTLCPLTTDHAALVNLLRPVQYGMLGNRTAIGNALATSVNRIKDSEGISKVIILLTDGSNNAGQITPLNAAEIAKTYGIRVYTIGVGTDAKTAPIPAAPNSLGKKTDYAEVDIDEPTLKKIAATTGGAYFRATDNQKLQSIYSEIDKMEKSKITVENYSKKNEEFPPFAVLLIMFLLAEIIIRYAVLRRIP